MEVVLSTMQNSSTLLEKESSCAITLGFAFIYLAWGGTYLGVKFAIVDLPVFLMSGSRFFLAGILLLAGIALFDRDGFRRGTVREWRDAAGIGFLLLVFGIGTGNWAQKYIESSVTAMVFSALPLWIILIDWLRPGGRMPTLAVAMGLLLGFAGVGLILLPTNVGSSSPLSLSIDLLLLLASLSWASGAVFSRHISARGSALLPVARQMIVAGAALLILSYLHGDLRHVDFTGVHSTAWLGFGYLVLIGSLGGYPIYIWLMRVCPPAKAATVPYVNLIVAVFLGWSLGHETITLRLLAGTAIILASVTIVLRTRPPAVVPAAD